jgi:uncharacterized protein (DUF4213/DUF364 family)
MIILSELLADIADDVPVRSVLVGARWTVVCSRYCGMASTLKSFGDSHPHGHSQVRDARKLHLKSARELAEYALSDDLLEASIGVAAINSLLDVSEIGENFGTWEINAYDVLADHGREANVAIVGHFPFVNRLRETTKKLWVVEQQPIAGEHPADAARDILPQADVVAITGSTLINHTLDELLSKCRPDALVMVLGPSTPLSPILFEHGVTFISGTRVVDEEAVLRTVAQGATFRQVEGGTLVTLTQNTRQGLES